MALYQPPLYSSESYGLASDYADPSSPSPQSRYSLQWPPAIRSEEMEQDALTLARFLAPVAHTDNTPVSEQVFGSQKRQLRLSLEHALNLMNERGQLHQRHMSDINHRHMQIQEKLFGARLHGRLDNYKRATMLERVLVQMDEQRRKEEIGCWKDTVELRQMLFESAKEYQAVRHRANLLGDTDVVPDTSLEAHG